MAKRKKRKNNSLRRSSGDSQLRTVKSYHVSQASNTIASTSNLDLSKKKASITDFFFTNIVVVLNKDFINCDDQKIEKTVSEIKKRAANKFSKLGIDDQNNNFWKLLDEQLYLNNQAAFEKWGSEQKSGLGLLKIFSTDLALKKHFLELIIKTYQEAYQHDHLEEAKLLTVVDEKKSNAFHILVSVLMNKIENVSAEISDQDIEAFKLLLENQENTSLLKDEDIYQRKPIDVLENLESLYEEVENIEKLRQILSTSD